MITRLLCSLARRGGGCAGLYAGEIVRPRFSITWIIGNPESSTGFDFNSVDTFFFLSGFLATWQLLEKVKGANPWKFVKGVLIHRYLRLTPLYFMVLMIYIYVFPSVGNGDHFGTGTTPPHHPPPAMRQASFPPQILVEFHANSR